MTKRLPFDRQSDLEEAVDAVRICLGNKGVILIPTETFYGLAADPADEEAIGRVYALKGRPKGMPLPVLVSGWPQIEGLCRVPEEHRRWLENQWPGKLTAILPLRLPLAASGGETLAVRIPDHELLRTLLEEVGPLTGTSANRSGRPPASSVATALESLSKAPDLILDGGKTAGGTPTKIIRFSGSQRLRVR